VPWTICVCCAGHCRQRLRNTERWLAGGRRQNEAELNRPLPAAHCCGRRSNVGKWCVGVGLLGFALRKLKRVDYGKSLSRVCPSLSGNHSVSCFLNKKKIERFCSGTASSTALFRNMSDVLVGCPAAQELHIRTMCVLTRAAVWRCRELPGFCFLFLCTSPVVGVSRFGPSRHGFESRWRQVHLLVTRRLKIIRTMQ